MEKELREALEAMEIRLTERLTRLDIRLQTFEARQVHDLQAINAGLKSARDLTPN